MYIDQITAVIPQMNQVQYDTYTQLIYVDKTLLALGFNSLNIDNNLSYKPDNKVEELLKNLQSLNPENLSPADHKKVSYLVAVRLGLYDAASFINNEQSNGYRQRRA